MEPMLTKLSWDWLDIWFLGFLALQVSKETRFWKGLGTFEYSVDLPKRFIGTIGKI